MHIKDAVKTFLVFMLSQIGNIKGRKRGAESGVPKDSSALSLEIFPNGIKEDRKE